MRRYRKRGFRTEWVGLNPVQPRLTAGTVKAAHETAEARRESPGFIRGEEVKLRRPVCNHRSRLAEVIQDTAQHPGSGTGKGAQAE